MNSITVQSPTRVDLAGGTLDLWPLYNFIGGAMTVNVAIDVYTKVILTPQVSSQITIESKDLSLNKKFKNIDELFSDPDPYLSLFKSVLRFWRPTQGFSLSSESQSPVGGGLGGSSSLTVSLMKAFSQWLNRPFKSTHDLVHICHNLESEVLNTPTGTQDYYPAASGGLNILKYSSEGIEQKILPAKQGALLNSFLLVYTGKSHHSGMNNFEVVKSAVAKNPETLKYLNELKQISIETVNACEKQDWSQLPALFNREFASRVKLAPAFTSPEIEMLQQISMQNGALAVKICGAGGGGCVLVWTTPDHRQKVRDACEKAGFHPMNAQPVDPI